MNLRKMQMGLVAGAALMLTAGSSFAQQLPPSDVKFFGQATVGVGGTTTMELSVRNFGTTDYTAVTFTDTLPADIIVSTPNGLLSACIPGSTLGVITATAGGNTVSVGPSVVRALVGSCTVQVNVTGTAPGALPNTFVATDAVAGAGNAATATLTVLAIAPPSIAKAFNPTVVQLNGNSTLTITITAAQALAGVSFTDTLPAGLAVVALQPTTGTCSGGSVNATIGGTNVSAKGLTFAAAGSCTITVIVTGITVGAQVNTVQATDINAGAGNIATATLDVVLPPAITKSFANSPLQLFGPGNTTALTFTITNPAANPVPLTGIAFTDTLPAGLIVATPNGLTGSCGGGPITAIAGTNTISLSGATLAAGASCTFSVDVSAIAIGVWVNTTSPVTAMTGTIVGNAATATVVVNDLFFIWFFSADGGGHP